MQTYQIDKHEAIETYPAFHSVSESNGISD
jgi:hypothetical protein